MLAQNGNGFLSRGDTLLSSTLVPAVSEREQAQKMSREAQMESLLEEFRQAREDADENLPEVMEIYKAKLRSLLEEVSSSAEKTSGCSCCQHNGGQAVTDKTPPRVLRR